MKITMNESKRIIYYWDDEEKFLTKFRERHNEYNIELFSECNEIIKRLAQALENEENIPDLILLDLFHTFVDPSSEENKCAEKQLKELDESAKNLLSAINNARKPEGINVLKEIRGLGKDEHEKKLLEEIPILLYTRRGISILDDSQLQDIATCQGVWMIKKELSSSEDNEIDNEEKRKCYEKDCIKEIIESRCEYRVSKKKLKFIKQVPDVKDDLRALECLEEAIRAHEKRCYRAGLVLLGAAQESITLSVMDAVKNSRHKDDFSYKKSRKKFYFWDEREENRISGFWRAVKQNNQSSCHIERYFDEELRKLSKKIRDNRNEAAHANISDDIYFSEKYDKIFEIFPKFAEKMYDAEKYYNGFN